MTRHNENHKMWQPTEKSTAPFKNLPGKGWYVFNTEVLHNKTPDVKDTQYIFDIVVADSELLLDKTFEERMKILNMLFVNDKTKECYSHYEITSNVWLAKTIKNGFNSLWAEINKTAQNKDGAPVDEGLVLKNPNAKMKMPSKKNANGSWMVKCRVKHENYTF